MIENYEQIHKDTKSIKPIRFKIIVLIVTIILVIFFFIIASFIFHSVKVAIGVSGIWQQAQELLDDVNKKDWQRSANLIGEMREDLNKANSDLGKLGPIGRLPKIKNDIYIARHFLTIAEDLASGYEETFNLFEEVAITGIDFDLFTILKNDNALNLISKNKERLSSIENNISRARIDFNELNIENFSGFFADELIEAYIWIGQIIDSTDLAIPAIANLPELLGFEEEKKYLVVFQNNMELRPTGGFIGSYGIVTVKDGEIKNIFTDDVYNLDKLSEGKMEKLAPEQMFIYNNQRLWYMRDANWFANWPDSAKNIADFFHEERIHANLPSINIDGVIAITPDFIANLIDVVGPIESHGVVFSGDNFAMDLERFVEFDFENYNIPFDQRKAIIGNLSQILIERIEKHSYNNLLDLWLAFKKNIDEKNILVYLFDEELQRYFSDRNWAGEVRQTDGDYLMVVDSNFASLKTDSVMERSINRELKINESGDLIARLEITYKHTGSFVRHLVTRYRTYARVYVPEGSWFERGWIKYGEKEVALIMGDDLDYGSQFGKVYAGYFVIIEPGDSKTVILEYRLPEIIKNNYKNGEYSLLIQKQPGTSGHDLDIYFNFDKIISAYNSASMPSDFGGDYIIWKDILSVDKMYRMRF